MPLYPSEAWMREWVEKINASKEYEEAAATWEGDVCFVFEPQPEKGIAEELWTWMDLWHGKCRGYKYDLSPEEGAKARFVMRAPYSRWKEVVRKELDPVKGLMMGKIKLKGDTFTMIRHVKAAKALVNVAASVDTQFIDEQS